MRFAVLGSVEVRDGDRVVEVKAHKQRVLLATLVSRAPKPVPADVLIEALWRDEPPNAVRKALGWHLLQLRTALGDAENISFQPGGYVLRAAADDVDATEFQRLLREGQAITDASPELASRFFIDALALWRGNAYEDVSDVQVLFQEARRLEELRLATLECHVDCGLRLGRHAELIPELTALVSGNPHRQRFRAQLMLALYRCGRQAEALKTYRDGHRIAASELGLNPGRELRELEQRILDGDPELNPPTVAGSARAPLSPPPVPRQLPADIATFTGRDAEAEALLHQVHPAPDRKRGTIVVSAVDGMAGIGKTTLAVRVAHRLAPAFPDGQLFIDLHGFSGDVAPVTPADALDRLLRAMGVTGSQIPAHVDERAAWFRSVLNGKRVLLVLDNAANEEQVRPLLPGGPEQATLITSRRRLAGLDAAAVNLDLLDARHGFDLFVGAAGLTELTGDQRAQVEAIVSRCGGLPLAIRLAAHRLRRNPSWELSDLHQRLRRQERALSTLDLGEHSVAAVFRMSYRELDDALRRSFRLLSLYPGPHFDAYAATALAGLDFYTARDHLDELHDARLLESRTPGRYRFHDLVRQYAAQELTAAGDDTRAALTRLLDGFRHTAYSVANLAYPNVKHYPYVPPTPAFPVPVFDDADAATAWYDTEVRALHGAVRLAVDNELDDHAWQLAHPLDALNHYRGNVTAGLAMNHDALEAARRLADPEVLALALNNVATCHVMLSQFEAAIRALTEALELRRRTGDVRGQAAALNNRGNPHRLLGEFGAAAADFEAAIACARQAGDERFEAIAIANYASVCDHLEQWDRALGLLERAREICVRRGFERPLARVDHWCGVTYLYLGQPKRALEHLNASRVFAERVGGPFALGEVLNTIANSLRALDRHTDALRHHRLALDLSGDNGEVVAHARNLTDFGRTLLAAGQVDAAIEVSREARTLAAGVGSRYGSARAAHALADALIASGDNAGARRHLDDAVDAYTTMEVPAAARLREQRERLAAG